jgi:phenylacetate-CoA ligase
MIRVSYEERRRLEQLEPDALAAHQLQRLNTLLATILPHNRLYAERLAGAKLPLRSLADLAELPLTTKDDLLPAPDSEGFAAHLAANHTWSPEAYVRFHRTSGTHGRPLVVLDTADDWQWWIDAWQFVLDAAEIEAADRVVMAFSFGPFVGFWSAFDAAVARGALVVPSGGMSTQARLDLIQSCGATVVFCTPSYALHMAETAAKQNFELRSLPVRRIVVAGEPGGSVPTTRSRIESAWNARVVDHSGASEVGPWGYGDADRRGLYVNECDFLPEFLKIGTDEVAEEGELAELVITTLGRAGCPVIRYRTGDVVRCPRRDNPVDRACRFAFLEGGILGRADDMLIVRGVNVFPSSIDEILRGFREIAEYRVRVVRTGQLDALSIEIEDTLAAPERVAEAMQLRLGLKVEVLVVPGGTLPRFEGKGKRFLDER